MNNIPILENHFYHDGRGPELQRVVWKRNGVILDGFEYFNPHDGYETSELKNITLKGVQVFAMTTEEVHANIVATGDSKASIYRIENSEWMNTFFQTHLGMCHHYQIMFYDEIYDVICEDIAPGHGKIDA